MFYLIDYLKLKLFGGASAVAAATPEVITGDSYFDTSITANSYFDGVITDDSYFDTTITANSYFEV